MTDTARGTRPPALAGRAGHDPSLAAFALTDGTVLAVRHAGPENSPGTVVLVHGWTQDHTSWDDVTDRVAAQGVRVVAYDARGHGWSDAGPRGTATIDRFADDLAEVITGLVPDGRVVVAGHSLGGPIILAFADRHPDLLADRVAGVALVATSASGLGKDIFGLSSRLTAPALLAAPWLTKMRSVSRSPINTRHPRLIAGALRLGLYGPGAATERNRMRTAAQVGRSHPATTAQLVDEMLGHDRLDALRSLGHVATVIMAGTKDALTPMAHARAMAAAAPNSELVVFPRAGHMLPYERADEVAATLVDLSQG